MRIQHNIMAMNAYRNYNNNVSAMKKNLEKLSSGYKINRAGDDAAGLAISEKMRAQITGLETAQKNAKDGISLVQTAEGALTEVHDMLNRMVTLATQSANGTYDNEVDRAQLQKELDQLRDEIDRIADSSNFNGIKLLDGTQTAQSANPLGDKAELLEALDGMKATPGGKATISFKTTAAGGSPVPESATVDSLTDGQPMNQAGKPAKVTIDVGGIKNDAAGFDISGTINSATVSTTKDLTSAGTGSWGSGDTITITDADGNNYTYTQADCATWADVVNAAKADGITLNAGSDKSATATHSKLTGLVDSSGNAAIIEGGATDVGTLKGMSLTSGGPTLGSMYDIVLKDSNGTIVGSVTDATVIENGYSIELTAKYGGEMSSTDQGKFAAIAQDASTGVPSAVAGGATIDDTGLNEGNATTSSGADIYKLTFDFSKLAVGQSFSIGDKTIYFSNSANLPDGNTPGTNDKVIDLSSITDDGTVTGNVADIYDDIARAINSALTDSSTGAFAGIFTGQILADATDTSGKTYTITLSEDTAATTAPTSAQLNLGAVRLSSAAAHSDLLHTTYTAKKDSGAAPSQPSTDEFATVTYKNVDLSKLTAGSSIEIAGKKVEVVGSDYEGATGFIAASGSNPDRYVLKLASATATAGAADLTNAFEQLGFDKGQVSFDAGNKKVTIKGTAVGQTGAALENSLSGGVKITPPAAAATSITIGGATIQVNTTDLKDLLTTEITYGTGSNQKTFKLGDAFKIEVGGTEVTSSTTGKVGGNVDVVLTAKNVGQLSDDVLAALTPTDATGTAMEVTQVNGYDEGSNPAGMKTEYGLSIDLSKAAGGNSFTFGNKNGTGKSITFELSYDNLGTLNGTVDNNNHVDVAENGDERVQINLFGLSNADATKAIETAVKNAIGNDFDVKASLSGSNVVLSAIGKNDWDADTNDTNWGEVRFSTSEDAKQVFSDNIYNPAGGVASSQIGTYAQLSYSFDPGKIKAGDELTIGGTTIYFGDTDKIETVTDDSGNNVTKVTVKAEELGKNPNKIVSAFERAGFTAGQLKIADGKVTITDANKTGNTAKDFEATLKGSADSVISLKRELDKGADGMQGGLVLQIGDTAESFNQLRVSIQDMHTTSLGLSDISIADQTSAAKAVDAIKAAINQVSDVRGTLGATQNRLDHTINNLSVMTENIQDAESTIRDTDVASEMMAYTKNNILIQSAQAMLAQANQVPQGVLQLLQ